MLSLALLRSQARSTADLAHSRAISTSLAQSSNILSKMAVINPTVQLYIDALQVSGWQQVSWQDSTQTDWQIPSSYLHQNLQINEAFLYFYWQIS